MNTSPIPGTPEDHYRRVVEDAYQRWNAEIEALDGRYALQLTRISEQHPAMTHGEYLQRRGNALQALNQDLSTAADAYQAEADSPHPPQLNPEITRIPEPVPAPGNSVRPLDQAPAPAYVAPRIQPVPAPPTRQVKPRPPLWVRVAQWGAAAVVLTLVVAVGIYFASGASTKSNKSSSTTTDEKTSAYSSTVTVLYEVEGTATGADVTLGSATGTVQGTGKAVPLTNKTTGKRGLTFMMPRGHFVYLSAQNTGGSGTITCRITVDGEIVSTNTSSGGYSIASCSGSAR
ncbi:hypothetical protein [Arthrobacter sp. R-11]|uniref:hypothetical protein n=1 Tax=Arthrobacter sp. R-11 TaxID=3404053 RepID=UPI003CF26DFC